MAYNTTLVYQRYVMPHWFHSLLNKITNFLDKKEHERHDQCMRGQEYHMEGTEWPWRIFTLVFNKLFSDIVGTRFLKICSALRVPQTGKKKKKVIKENQNGRSTRQIHDTGKKCGLILGPNMQIIPKEKKQAVCHCTGPRFYLSNNTAIQSLMFKQN